MVELVSAEEDDVEKKDVSDAALNQLDVAAVRILRDWANSETGKAASKAISEALEKALMADANMIAGVLFAAEKHCKRGAL